MDDAVVVTVHAVLLIVRVERIFFVAREIGLELVADVNAVGHVPVVIHSGVNFGSRAFTARIEDQAETEHTDDKNHGWEHSAALEADLLGLALLGQTRNFCRTTLCHG